MKQLENVIGTEYELRITRRAPIRVTQLIHRTCDGCRARSLYIQSATFLIWTPGKNVTCDRLIDHLLFHNYIK